MKWKEREEPTMAYPQYVYDRLEEQKQRAHEERRRDAELNAHFQRGGTITIVYQLAGEDAVVIPNANAEDWRNANAIVARSYLRRGAPESWPRYELESL